MTLKYEYLECTCESAEHVIRFTIDIDDDFTLPEAYLEVQLYPYHSIFERIWKALKYICGYQCRYGHWDCVVLGPEQIDQLRSFCFKYDKKARELNE